MRLKAAKIRRHTEKYREIQRNTENLKYKAKMRIKNDGAESTPAAEFMRWGSSKSTLKLQDDENSKGNRENMGEK